MINIEDVYIDDKKFTKKELKLNASLMRKLTYIFPKNTRLKILDEVSYFSKIYPALPIEQLIEVVVSKYVKIKIYKIVYLNIDKDVMEYKRKIIKDIEEGLF